MRWFEVSRTTTRTPALPEDGVAADVGAASRLSAAFALCAALGGIALHAGGIAVESSTLYWTGLISALLVTPLYVAVPWSRFGRWPLLLASNGPGIVLTTEVVWNTGGIDSPYVVYFSALVVVCGLYATRRQLLVQALIVFLAGLTPLLYDDTSDIIVITQNVFVVGLAAIVAALLQESRERSRSLSTSLRELASRDGLTGAWNRRELHERGERELARAARAGAPTTVLYLDLDGFKAVNDQQGHTAGDRVLVAVAEAARSSLRLSDVLARPGGDEFAVLLPETGADEARQAAERLVADIAEAVREWGVTASVGSATAPEDGADIEVLLTTADHRMLESKQAGRGAREARAASAR